MMRSPSGRVRVRLNRSGFVGGWALGEKPLLRRVSIGGGAGRASTRRWPSKSPRRTAGASAAAVTLQRAGPWKSRRRRSCLLRDRRIIPIVIPQPSLAVAVRRHRRHRRCRRRRRCRRHRHEHIAPRSLPAAR